MIITCPHCGTRYQVAKEAIGAEGREVQCANCTRPWQARPELTLVPKSPPPAPPDMSRGEEAVLDAALEAEEKAVALAEHVISGSRKRKKGRPTERMDAKPAAAALAAPQTDTRQDQAFTRRQSRLFRQLPQARIRRAIRFTMLAVFLAAFASFLVFRVEIVRQFPALAGVYSGLGLPVNVVGLELSDVKTMRTVSSGSDVLQVEARIRSTGGRVVEVPSVVVTLLDVGGRALYAWSVTPEAQDLGPGETIAFETRLTSPPHGAERVKLTFAAGRTQTDAALDVLAGTTTPKMPLDGLAAEPQAEAHAEPEAVETAPEEHHEPAGGGH